MSAGTGSLDEEGQTAKIRRLSFWSTSNLLVTARKDMDHSNIVDGIQVATNGPTNIMTYSFKNMRFFNRSIFLASLIFLLGGSSVIGFVPSRIHKRAASISTLPRIHDAKVWNKAKRTIRPVGFRERPSTLQATATLVAGMKALHSNTSYVLSLILWLSAFGISLERRTVIGKALSAPLATMALALATANIGLLPFHSPVYNMVNRYLVPLALPMLLFDSDLKRVINDTGTLLAAFGVGAFATIVGTILTFMIIPLQSLGPDVGWRVACALAARHIGGAINFVAVAETLKIGGTTVSAAIAADNVVVALYFAFLFSISKAGDEDQGVIPPSTTDQGNEAENTPMISELAVEQEGGSSITLPSLAISISVSSTLVSAGVFLTGALLPAGTSSLPLISVLTVIAATLFPKFFARISETGMALGITFIQLFFAASGAAGSIRLVLQKAPALFAFSALQIGIHFAALMAVGRGIFRLPHRELYLASNANVGGPTTAAAMAQAKEWKRLVAPALLIGILGYATATALALSLGPILLRLPLMRWGS